MIENTETEIAVRTARTIGRWTRKGTAAVEFAVVLPVVVLLCLGGIEIGRAVMVQHTLSEASRAAARIYAVSDTTPQETTTMIDAIMANANMSGYSISLDPSDHNLVDTHMEEVTVSVSIPYTQVAWLSPWFMGDSTMESITIMPADTGDYVAPNGSSTGDSNSSDSSDDSSSDDSSSSSDDSSSSSDDSSSSSDDSSSSASSSS